MADHAPRYFMSFECRCGSRATKRVGYLLRECSECGETYAYRLHNGVFAAMSPLTATLLDIERKSPGRVEGDTRPPSAWSYPGAPRPSATRLPATR